MEAREGGGARGKKKKEGESKEREHKGTREKS